MLSKNLALIEFLVFDNLIKMLELESGFSLNATIIIENSPENQSLPLHIFY